MKKVIKLFLISGGAFLSIGLGCNKGPQVVDKNPIQPTYQLSQKSSGNNQNDFVLQIPTVL
jgi:hypothetical protein